MGSYFSTEIELQWRLQWFDMGWRKKALVLDQRIWWELQGGSKKHTSAQTLISGLNVQS